MKEGLELAQHAVTMLTLNYLLSDSELARF